MIPTDGILSYYLIKTSVISELLQAKILPLLIEIGV